MKRFQLILLILLAMNVLAHAYGAEKSHCRIAAKVEGEKAKQELVFSLIKNEKTMNTYSNIDSAMKRACHLHNNGECFYSETCP